MSECDDPSLIFTLPLCLDSASFIFRIERVSDG